MGDEVELLSDGDGLAVIGEASAVERFIAASGLAATGTATAFKTGASLAQTGAAMVSHSSRWVKLTPDSVERLNRYGLTPTKTPGVSHAMLGPRGSIKSWIQIENPGIRSALTNPATLSGAAGIMAQMAMQQTMDEILDYLKIIDEKLDGVLRAQTNQVLARLDGVDLAVREAMSVRASVGRVSEVTWSKVQSSAQTIHEVQGFALRQLADLADTIEEKSKKIGELAETSKQAAGDVQKWLVVLARCFELHDAVGVLELDRVLDASPDELDRHRIGLQSARRDRLALISERTEQLLSRMSTAVGMANSKVLFNPVQSPAIVRSSNQVAGEVHEFRELLGIKSGAESAEARAWSEAASESWDKARETGAAGAGAVKQLGGGARDRALSAKGKVAGRFADRKRRKAVDGAEDDVDEPEQADGQ